MIKEIYLSLSAAFLYYLIVLINKTLKVKTLGEQHFKTLKAGNQHIIFAFWHGETFIPIYHYRDQQACILTATSLRGEVLTRVAHRLGYQAVRLPAKESGIRGFRSILQLIRIIKQGRDCNIAVDGPEGPAYQVKPGVIYAAYQTGYPILPIASAAARKITFKFRWDKYFIPRLKSRVCIAAGAPIYIDNLDVKDENQVLGRTRQLTRVLNELSASANQEVLNRGD